MPQKDSATRGSAKLEPISVSRGAAILSAVVIVICYVYSIDPARIAFGADNIASLRYVPTVSACAIAIYIAATAKMQRRAIGTGVVWLLAAIFMWQLIGGLASISAGYDAANSYLGRGLATMAAIGGALVGGSMIGRGQVTNIIVTCGVAFAFVGGAIRILHGIGLIYSELPQVLHEEQFLISAGLTYFAVSQKKVWNTILIFVATLVLALVSHKATTWILVGIGAVIMVARPSLQALRRRGGTAVFAGAVIATGLTLCIVWLAIQNWQSARPNDWRNLIFSERWQQFVDSPLWGTGYFGTPLIEGLPGMGILLVPGHSDWLDQLAFGGLLAAAAFALVFVAALTWRGATQEFFLGHRSPHGYVYYVVAFFVVASSANPILASPRLGTIVWFCLGLLIGYRLSVRSLSDKTSGVPSIDPPMSSFAE